MVKFLIFISLSATSLVKCPVLGVNHIVRPPYLFKRKECNRRDKSPSEAEVRDLQDRHRIMLKMVTLKMLALDTVVGMHCLGGVCAENIIVDKGSCVTFRV